MCPWRKVPLCSVPQGTSLYQCCLSVGASQDPAVCGEEVAEHSGDLPSGGAMPQAPWVLRPWLPDNRNGEKRLLTGCLQWLLSTPVLSAWKRGLACVSPGSPPVPHTWEAVALGRGPSCKSWEEFGMKGKFWAGRRQAWFWPKFCCHAEGPQDLPSHGRHLCPLPSALCGLLADWVEVRGISTSEQNSRPRWPPGGTWALTDRTEGRAPPPAGSCSQRICFRWPLKEGALWIPKFLV